MRRARRRSLDALARTRRRLPPCALLEPATQTVFGEGPRDARVLLVGEQPGDAEDLSGHPFVGPAGQLLRPRAGGTRASTASTLYLTNAVKHFRFERRGKLRLHGNRHRRTHAPAINGSRANWPSSSPTSSSASVRSLRRRARPRFQLDGATRPVANLARRSARVRHGASVVGVAPTGGRSRSGLPGVRGRPALVGGARGRWGRTIVAARAPMSCVHRTLRSWNPPHTPTRRSGRSS